MYVSFFELEGQSPVAANPDRPAVLHTAFEWMQLVPGYIHIVYAVSGIQGRKLQPKFSA